MTKYLTKIKMKIKLNLYKISKLIFIKYKIELLKYLNILIKTKIVYNVNNNIKQKWEILSWQLTEIN